MLGWEAFVVEKFWQLGFKGLKRQLLLMKIEIKEEKMEFYIKGGRGILGKGVELDRIRDCPFFLIQS